MTEHRENFALAPLLQARLLRTAARIMERDSFVKLKTRLSDAIVRDSRRHPQALHELELQRLIEEKASFAVMRTVLAKLYAYDRSVRFQAQLVELAFLHGKSNDVQEMLKFLALSGKDFYLHINATVRERLLPRDGSEDSPLGDILLLHRDSEALTAAERLYILQLLGRLDVPSELLVYFEQHRALLLSAAQTQRCDLDALYLMLGKAALQTGYLDGCRKFLHHINPQSQAYRTALRILLIPPAKDASNRVLQSILAEQKWENRLTLLDSYLTDAAHKNPLSDKNRPALNAVVSDPLALLPKTTAAWTALSQVLVRHRAQLRNYPDLYRVFRQNSEIFYGAGLDTALWNAFLTLKAEDDRHRRLCGIAHIHHYINCGSDNEKALWLAKTILVELGEMELWQRLHAEALRYVQQAKIIPLAQRQRMLSQLKVACHGRDLALSEVQAYVPLSTSRYVLTELEAAMRSQQATALELDIIWRKANLAHLQNRDLDRIWALALKLGWVDLAWRTATVLNARQALHSRVRGVWQASGEKRSTYPLLWKEEAVKFCTAGLRADEQKFLTAFFSIAAMIPALFARLDPRARRYRRPARRDDKQRQQIETFLDAIPQLAPSAHSYYFSSDGMLARNQQLPLFIRNMPDTVWSMLFARLAERLSLNLWSWQLSVLMGLIDKVLPRFITRSKITTRGLRWLRDLRPQQRLAWNMFVATAACISDPRAEELFGTYLCRLTTCMYQNHYQALLSLQLMSAPLSYIWGLEKFILAEQYFHLRQQLGCLHRVNAPQSVVKMSSILA